MDENLLCVLSRNVEVEVMVKSGSSAWVEEANYIRYALVVDS